MRLGYNTNGLRDHRLEEALGLLADHGYGAVAITPDVGCLDPETVTPRAVDRIAARLDRLDLHPVMETGARFVLDPARKHHPNLMSPEPDDRARRVAYYRAVAGLGADLGAEVVSFWSGVDPAPGPDSGRRLRDGVLAAVDAIAGAGLQAALEPEPGMAVPTVRAWQALRAELEATGHPPPGLALDVGHLWVDWEGDPYALTAARGPELLQVHLEDMRRGEHVHLPPGEGEVDFARVRRALAAAGYRGPVCFELSRDSHRAPEMVARCAAVWAAAGQAGE